MFLVLAFSANAQLIGGSSVGLSNGDPNGDANFQSFKGDQRNIYAWVRDTTTDADFYYFNPTSDVYVKTTLTAVGNTDITLGNLRFEGDDLTYDSIDLVNNVVLGQGTVSFLNYVKVVDLASTALNKGASLVGIQDVQDYYTGVEVEAALQEIADTLQAHLTELNNDGDKLSNNEIQVLSSNIVNSKAIEIILNNGGGQIDIKGGEGVEFVDDGSGNIKIQNEVLTKAKNNADAAAKGVPLSGFYETEQSTVYFNGIKVKRTF